MTSVAEKRLASQGMLADSFKHPAEVVRHLGAIQAQDYAGAKWSVGLRLNGSSDDEVEQAIESGAIVRTWALRGTLHLVAVEDVHWLLTLIAPRIIKRNARRYRQLELDESTLAKSSQLLAGALDEGQKLDRQALRAILEKGNISTAGQRLFYMLQRASLDGLICQETAPRNNPIFVRLAPPPVKPSFDRDKALAKLAVRYFAGHGPATLDDFVWWSGLLVADARAGLENAEAQLMPETIAGKTYWHAPDAAIPGNAAATMVLLPPFDEVLVGYRDRSASIAESDMAAWSRGKAMFTPSLIRRGQVIGLWKKAVKRSVVEVEIELFTELTAADHALLQQAADNYGRFLDRTALVRIP